MPRSKWTALNENFARSRTKTKHARDRPPALRAVNCQTCYLSNPKKFTAAAKEGEESCVFAGHFHFGKKRIVTLAEPAEPRSVDAVARVCLHSGSCSAVSRVRNPESRPNSEDQKFKKKAGREILFPCRVSLDCSTVRPSSSSSPVKRGHNQQQQKQRSRNSCPLFLFVRLFGQNRRSIPL